MGVESLMPVSDSASGEIVGGKFQRDAVAVHYFDAIPPQLTRHRRKHGRPCVEFNGEHAGAKLFDNLAQYFDRIFFWQSVPLIEIALEWLVAISTALAAATAIAATAAATIFFRTRFVDIQRSSVQIPPIDFGNRTIAFGVVAHFHETKTAGLARFAVRYDADTLHRAVGLKQGANSRFRASETEVPDKNILHLNLLSEICRTANRQDQARAAGTGRGRMRESTNCQTTFLSSHESARGIYFAAQRIPWASSLRNSGVARLGFGSPFQVCPSMVTYTRPLP